MRIALTLLLTLMTLPLWAMSYTLHPGRLATVLREIEKEQTDNVTFEGEILLSELEGLRHLPRSVTNLDLSQLIIISGDPDGSDAWELPSFALFATNVKTLRLPDGLTAIGEGALAETPLESLYVPANVTVVGPRAFYNCKSLKNVNFSDCKITELPDECFTGCAALEELGLPYSLNEIGDRTLMRTAVKSLVIPSVRKIGRFALAEMPHLSSLSIRNGVEMDEGVFFNTPKLQGMKYLTFPAPVLGFALSGKAVEGNIVDDVVIREGVFSGANPSTIILGKSVQEIEAHAFRNVGGLQSVDVTAKGENVPILSEDAFSGVDVSKIRLKVLQGNESMWCNAPGWKDFIIESSAGIAESAADAVTIKISGSKGMVEVSSDAPLLYVAIYSVGGMVLFERAGCGEALSAGPFDVPAVIVRAVTATTTHVATLHLH